MARFRAARRLRRTMYPFDRTPAEVALYYLIAIRAPRLLNTAVGIPVSDNLDSTTRPRYSVCLLQRAATSLALSATCT